MKRGLSFNVPRAFGAEPPARLTGFALRVGRKSRAERAHAWSKIADRGRALEAEARKHAKAHGLSSRWVPPESAKGHRLAVCGPLLFCFVCGSYTQSRTHKLGKACAKKVSKPTTLHRLLAGRHPLGGRPLGEPRLAALHDLGLAHP